MTSSFNQVVCGNHLDILKEYPDGFFDMVLTSPPYGERRDYEGYDFQFESLAEELYRVMKDCGVGVWIVTDETIKGGETLESFRQAMFFQKIGFNVETMIYHKNCSQPNVFNPRYIQSFEYMFVIVKGKAPNAFNPLMRRNSLSGKKKYAHSITQKNGERITYGRNISKVTAKESKRHNIWSYEVGFMKTSKDKDSFQHPATFPEKLAEDHILSWSNPGDVILDPMCGSGTTCKMAVKHQRQYVGIDISEKYCELARTRLDRFTKQITIFDSEYKEAVNM